MRRIHGRRRPIPHDDCSVGQEHNRHRGAARGGRGARFGQAPQGEGDDRGLHLPQQPRLHGRRLDGVPQRREPGGCRRRRWRRGRGRAGSWTSRSEPSPCRPTSPRRSTRSHPPVPTSTACRTATRAGTSSRSKGRRQTRQGNGGSPSLSMPLPRAVPDEVLIRAPSDRTPLSRRAPFDRSATGRPKPDARPDARLHQPGSRRTAWSWPSRGRSPLVRRRVRPSRQGIRRPRPGQPHSWVRSVARPVPAREAVPEGPSSGFSDRGHHWTGPNTPSPVAGSAAKAGTPAATHPTSPLRGRGTTTATSCSNVPTDESATGVRCVGPRRRVPRPRPEATTVRMPDRPWATSPQTAHRPSQGQIRRSPAPTARSINRENSPRRAPPPSAPRVGQIIGRAAVVPKQRRTVNGAESPTNQTTPVGAKYQVPALAPAPIRRGFPDVGYLEVDPIVIAPQLEPAAGIFALQPQRPFEVQSGEGAQTSHSVILGPSDGSGEGQAASSMKTGCSATSERHTMSGSSTLASK